MTPQLKYALIFLFIILDICIVVYFFTDTFTLPVKQAVVTQTTAPPQTVGYQAPVQPPAPTPAQLLEAQRQAAQRAEEARQLTECNQKQADYTRLFVEDSPSRLRQIYTNYNSLHDPRPAGMALEELLQQMRDRRASWEVEKRRCLQVPNWRQILSDADVSRVLREDCLQRSRNYGGFFELMQNMSESQKERFLAARSPKEPPYHQFVANWEALDRQCAQDISGWTTPPETRAAYQRQATTTR